MACCWMSYNSPLTCRELFNSLPSWLADCYRYSHARNCVFLKRSGITIPLIILEVWSVGGCGADDYSLLKGLKFLLLPVTSKVGPGTLPIRPNSWERLPLNLQWQKEALRNRIFSNPLGVAVSSCWNVHRAESGLWGVYRKYPLVTSVM